ncbi:MAG: hypothetical protein AAGD38_22970 [Acidobacteriota bacterium]
MTKKLFFSLLIAALALASAPLLFAQPAGVQDELEYKRNDNVPNQRGGVAVRPLDPPQQGVRNVDRNVGISINYDDGVANMAPTVTSNSYGNQFNTGNGGPVKSYSVSTMNFFMTTASGTDNVFVSVFGMVNGTTAPVLTSVSVASTPGAFATHTFATPIAGTGTFLAGVWYTGGDVPGLGTGTAGGQGHHGMRINDIVGTGFTLIPGVNALVGVSTAFVPVELQSFSISDN